MEWEKAYLESLINALCPHGNVLEVGFHQGYSSALIQTFNPQSHIIIESDAQVAKNAIKWASNYTNVTVIQDIWQNTLPRLGIFDAIFFNQRLAGSRVDITEYKESGLNALNKGKEIALMLQEKIPQLNSIRYSDTDMDTFYEQVGQFHLEKLSYFLHELKCNRQISIEQYENRILKYRLKKIESNNNPLVEGERTCGIFTFLNACLDSHMHKGSRFSCFSSIPASNYENPQFFSQIITNPNFDYQEQFITVKVSSDYYKFDKALVMVVEKLT